MNTHTAVRWSVGELGERFGLATHVLRHWEDVGLLTPERDPAGRRVYSEPDVYRVAVIVSSKAAGMSLDQIRALLDAEADGRRDILREHLTDLEARMAEMERSRHLTEHALECRAHDIANCPNFRSHVADVVAGTRRAFAAPDRPAVGAHPGHEAPASA
ncbi:MerR family transcriptional regulator [Nocardioides sp. TF02-7]|uniref:helix-turn-helix domain-containing protein n=1 Tax=Nocardioides sp. TF02-7 TaxID=2917724 RepID=UPI001F059D58|nr:MerR family transcriptional regulator [Nocardioides sp. TF02-7]UMG94303.1 MerR family transcriptional regulator [Nocardioides sp. TF02-7]